MAETTNDVKNLQAQLADKMMGIFDGVANEQGKYYSEHPDKIPQRQDVDSIISKWANINMGISCGVGLIPGPWGMAAAIPEIAVIIRNQIVMVYEIGMAYGKREVLKKELLAGVFASALGTGGITLLTMHGGKILVRRASLRVFQKMDRRIAPEEQEYVQTLIDKAGVSDEEKIALLGSIDTDTNFSIDYAAFADVPDEAIGLLIDMVALAKRDGTFHISEKMYIKQVGKLLGFSDADIEETMASE